jgi:hypothetical protein
MLAVLRLDAANRQISDCVLVPASRMAKRYLWLASAADIPSAVRVETVVEMVDAIKARLGRIARKRRAAVYAKSSSCAQ